MRHDAEDINRMDTSTVPARTPPRRTDRTIHNKRTNTTHQRKSRRATATMATYTHYEQLDTQYTQQELDLQHRKQEQNTYAEEVGAILAAQKKLFRTKQHLTGAKEPYLFLERTNGDVELYENVKEQEFKVPGLPEGVEKTLILGTKWQQELPYAGKSIRVYHCHEDYAFPYKWGKPNVYQGAYPERIKMWLTDPKQITEIKVGNKTLKGIPIILDTANVNSEAMRDRERKMLIAWEQFKAKLNAANWAAWAKILLWGLLGLAAVIIAYNYFRPEPATVATVIQNASSTVGGITIG